LTNSRPLPKIKPDLHNIDDLVLDAGILIEYFSENQTPLQDWLEDNVFEDSVQIHLHCHDVTRSEIFYIKCRSSGVADAKNHVDELTDFIEFHSESLIPELAGWIKCAHTISLADCYSIATAIYLGTPVLFRTEKELTQSIVSSIQRIFNARILLISRF